MFFGPYNSDFTKKFKNFVKPRIFLRFLRPRAKKRFYQNFFRALGPKKDSIRIFFCALGPKSVLFHEIFIFFPVNFLKFPFPDSIVFCFNESAIGISVNILE